MEDIGYNVAGYKVDGKLIDLPFKDPKLPRFWEVEDHPLKSQWVRDHHIVNPRVTWVTVVDTRKETMGAALQYARGLKVPLGPNHNMQALGNEWPVYLVLLIC